MRTSTYKCNDDQRLIDALERVGAAPASRWLALLIWRTKGIDSAINFANALRRRSVAQVLGAKRPRRRYQFWMDARDLPF